MGEVFEKLNLDELRLRWEECCLGLRSSGYVRLLDISPVVRYPEHNQSS